MNNSSELTAKTRELIHLMKDRISMNPVSCKLLTEAWKETFPDEEAVAKYMAVLLEKLEAAEMRNAELAAECAALKKAIPPLKMINVDNNSWDDVSIAEDIGFNQAISAILRNLPQTPATDRFLAEQRAMGVEMLATLAGNECQRHKSVNDRAGVRKWKSIVVLCSDFAAKLRKEVKI